MSDSNESKSTNPNDNNAKILGYTSKLRSAKPLSDCPETARIKQCLESGGTAADVAEEAYRICHENAILRRELEQAKRALYAPQLTDSDVAHINSRIYDAASVKEVAEEAYRVYRENSHLRNSNNEVQGALREAKKKLAVKDDALSEMRAEYPEMRRLLQRTYGLMKDRINVPADLKNAYNNIMSENMYDWQPRLGTKKYPRTSAEKKWQRQDGGKEEKNEDKQNMKIILHMEHGKALDLSKSIADQELEEEEGEIGEEVLEVAPSKKRKGGVLEASKTKKARNESDLDEGEIEE